MGIDLKKIVRAFLRMPENYGGKWGCLRLVPACSSFYANSSFRKTGQQRRAFRIILFFAATTTAMSSSESSSSASSSSSEEVQPLKLGNNPGGKELAFFKHREEEEIGELIYF